MRVSMSSLIGQTLGNYRIIERLGEGGMGVVYKAQDLTLGRHVALKLLPDHIAGDRESVERFRREARTASALNHPNICTIYSFGDHDGHLMLAMELLDGEPLEKKIDDNGPLELPALINIATQVADALEAAHGEGVLHRDIKPANIFVTKRGQVKVLDFGLAKLASRDDDSRVTQHFASRTGTTVGTISYMSPEQARGQPLDSRTDLFSFGVVLYEMATGRQSFEGSTTAVIFDGILNRQPRPVCTLNASLPAELERIINKALEKDRMLRYQTAADLRADLQRLKRDSGTRVSVAAASAVSNPSLDTVVLPAPPDAAGAALTARRSFSITSTLAIVVGSLTLVLVLGGLALTWITTRWAQKPAAVPVTASQQPSAPPPEQPAPSPPAGRRSTPTPAAEAAQKAASPATSAPAPETASGASAPARGRAMSGEATAAQRLDIAQAKIANNLLEPALVDLRQIVMEYPTTRAAADAAFLAASLLEKLDRLDDAMAAHIEFNKRFNTDKRAADSRLRLAELTNRSRHPNRELAAREMLNAIVRDYPRTPQALSALQQKIRFESGRRQLREFDAVVNLEVPAVVTSLRTLTEQFPKHPGSMNALNRLAEMYLDLDQHALAAQALNDLGTRFPANPYDAWFRLGELYERRLKDPVRARDAYARVPPKSPKYRDAQRKLLQK
jgi:serine/threonine protein kinase/outer membrane protein assembly factor BamD (BamD/ComL family)